MKIKLLLIIIIVAFISCKNQDKTKIDQKIISLSGKVLEYNYGDDVYKVSFKPENKLHWKCLKGDEKGKEADEIYSIQRLNNHTLFVSWIESDGLGVSQVINLKDKTVNCFLKIEKEIIPLIGTVREL